MCWPPPAACCGLIQASIDKAFDFFTAVTILWAGSRDEIFTADVTLSRPPRNVNPWSFLIFRFKGSPLLSGRG